MTEPQPITPPKPLPDLKQVRCPDCGRMLAKARLTPGSRIEIQCKHCKAFAVLEAA
jgi:phage FluMu protein Com